MNLSVFKLSMRLSRNRQLRKQLVCRKNLRRSNAKQKKSKQE
jgi:hypothetical protein